MTDLLLALVPDYGLYLIMSVTFFAVMGIPLPSSVVAMTSGGFAATGDLVLGEVLIVIFTTYIIADQLAFTVGSRAKQEWLERLSNSKMLGSLYHRSEDFYQKRGVLAILLSRTVVSSIGPYIAYFCGAQQMKRRRFTGAALIGAAIWTLAYVMAGYLFAGKLPEMSRLVASFLMTGLAALFTIGFAAKLVFAWRKFETD